MKHRPPASPVAFSSSFPPKLPASRFPAARVLCCLPLLLLLGGCATGGSAAVGGAAPSRGVPATALVTDGPSLALVGEYAGMRLEGYMDRTCMAGFGTLGLRAVSQYRRGDMAVAVPSLPDPQAGPAPAAAPAQKAEQHRLALAGYPARQPSHKAGQAGTQLSPSPTARASTGPRDSGLQLASYPQDQPSLSVETRVPEEMGHELLPGSPLLRTQSSNAAEFESSVPVAVEFVCEAKVDAPPTDKARIRGVLQCTGGRNLLFSLRNTGPDQGVGIGKETEDGSLMVLFYHASMAEAHRRFPSVREDILLAQQRR